MDALRSKKWVSALTVVALIALPGARAADAVTFDPKAALTQMYGGVTWKDPRLTRYFQWSKPKGGAEPRIPGSSTTP